MRLSALLAEARRRKVFRTAGIYAVGAAGVWGAAEVAVDALGLPPAVLTFVVVTSIVGFPFALVLSWFYQLSPESDPEGSGDAPSLSKAIAVGLTAAIVGFVGLAASVAMQGEPEPDAPVASAAFQRSQITYLGSAADPVFSPDGSHLAFHATFGDLSETFHTDSLMVMAPGETEPRALAVMMHDPPSDDLRLNRIHWSADGSEVWYLDADTTRAGGVRLTWYVVPVEGGAPRMIGEDELVVAISPDGEHYARRSGTEVGPGLEMVSLLTGERTTRVVEQPTHAPVALAWSPVGDRVALVTMPGTKDSLTLWSVPVGDGGQAHVLATWSGAIPTSLQWARNGESLYYDRDGRLWRVDVDPASGAPLTENGTFTGHDLLGKFTVSADGRRIIMEQRLGGSNLWLSPLVGDTVHFPGTRLTRGAYYRKSGRISPDGTRVAFSTMEDATSSRSRGLSTVRTDGTDERPVSSTPAWDVAWSPDGQRLAFIGRHEDTYRVFVVDADGRNQRLVGASETLPQYAITWCVTGEIIVPAKDGAGLTVLTPETDEERILRPAPPQYPLFPVCGPEGDRVAAYLIGTGERPTGLYILDKATGVAGDAVWAHPSAIAHTWPPGPKLYTQDAMITVESGEMSGYEWAGERLPGAIHSVRGDLGLFLMANDEATISDLYLIEYAREGRR